MELDGAGVGPRFLPPSGDGVRPLPAWLPEHEWQEVRRALRSSIEEALERQFADQERVLLRCLRAASCLPGEAAEDGPGAGGGAPEAVAEEKAPSAARRMDTVEIMSDPLAWGLPTRASRASGGSEETVLAHSHWLSKGPRGEVVNSKFSKVLRRMRTRALDEIEAPKLSHQLTHPQCQGCLARVLQHPIFDCIVLAVILGHFIFTIYTANKGTMDNLGPTFEDSVVENCFLGFYTVELFLKLLVHRLSFFYNSHWPWNLLDVCLVAVGLLDVISMQVSFARILRVVKVAKILRMLRVMRASRELRLLTDVLTGCMLSLFWSMVLLCFFLCLFSLFFVQSTRLLVTDAQVDQDTINELKVSFASVEVGMMSLLQSTTGGQDWGNLYDSILRTGVVNAMMFILFIVFFTVAALNIVTSLFVDKAMSLAKPEIFEVIREKSTEEKKITSFLLEACSAISDGSVVRRSDFRISMKDPKLQEIFRVVDLHFHDPDLFFDILVQGMVDHDMLDLSEFVHKCVAMRGPFVNMQLQVAAAHNHQACFQKYCAKQFQAISDAISCGVEARPRCPAVEQSTWSSNFHPSPRRELV